MQDYRRSNTLRAANRFNARAQPESTENFKKLFTAAQGRKLSTRLSLTLSLRRGVPGPPSVIEPLQRFPSISPSLGASFRSSLSPRQPLGECQIFYCIFYSRIPI